MGKQISITFRVGDEECNTVELPALEPHHIYKEEVGYYKSGYIVYKDRHLHFIFSVSLPAGVAKDLDLAVEGGK